MTNDSSSPRLVSLDQFRGYTVLGMFLVNFVGSFAVTSSLFPLLKHHHTFCSYADTIMPQFYFAVGFAYRLTFLRRSAADGPRAAWSHAVRRNLALILLGVIVHHLDGRYETWSELEQPGLWSVLAAAFQRNVFQTLTHIGVTSLWILPVIGARPAWRIGYAIGSAVLFHVLSEWGYYDWVMRRPGIDGGPLGFLTWTIPMIVGTLTYDLVADQARPRMPVLVGMAAGLMLLGYGLSCLNLHTPPARHLSARHGSAGYPADSQPRPTSGLFVEPPFVPPSRPVNIWTMSQRAGSVSYLTFGAGFSLAVYLLFVVACDWNGWQLGVLRTLGINALAGYIIHALVDEAISPLVPRDSPLWYVGLALAVYLAICYLFLRYLEKHRLYLKL
jgi:predicted acyltransferase